MSSAKFNTATVVMGMHRSGTSALTGALQLCGLEPPSTLLSAGDANKRGFWESEIVNSLDDEILKSAGLVWHSVGRINTTNVPRRFRSRICKVLEEEYRPGANVLIKDPRVCRLLPVWESALKEKAGAVAFPFIVRNPIEVAQSLQRRNQLDLDHGLLLCTRYLLDAELNTRGERRAFSLYRELLHDWRSVIGRFQTTLDLPLEITDQSAEEIDAYLSDGLRHHHGFDDDLLRVTMPGVRECYAILAGWSEGGRERQSDHEKLDGLRAQIDGISAAVADSFERSRLERKRSLAAKAEADKAAAKLSKAQESLTQLGEVRETLSGLRDDQRQTESRLGEVTDAFKRAAADRAALENALSESNRAASGLATQLKDARAELAKVADRHLNETAQLRAEVKEFQAAAAKAAEEQAAARADLTGQIERLRAESAKAAEAFTQERSELTAERDRLRKEAAQASQAHAKERSELTAERDRLRTEAAQASEAHAEERSKLTAERDRLQVEAAQAARTHAEERAELAARLDRISAQAAVAAERRATERAELRADLKRERAAAAAAVNAAEQQRSKLVEMHKERLANLASAHEGQLAKLAAVNERVTSELAISQGAGETLAEELEAIKRKYQSLDDELSRVKRKYRAAQHEAERKERALRKAKSELVAVENSLAGYQQSLPWRFYLALIRLWKRILAFGANSAGSQRKKRRAEMQLIANSGLFDAQWYLTEYPDVAAARIDPLTHFYAKGWREARDPGPQFATSAYLKANADVARSGANPVLHYIEYGRSEGRTWRASSRQLLAAAPGPLQPEAVSYDFAEAVPVYRGEVREDTPVYWQRSYRLSPDQKGAFVRAAFVIGFTSSRKQRKLFEAEFARLARLSGFDAKRPAPVEVPSPNAGTQLADGWYVNDVQLRTRWKATEWPQVIRAYQHDPVEGDLELVAEGLVTSALDVLDVHLVDPYFPVLFVACDPKGVLRDASLLAFPTLCRGGLHYPELIALSPDDPDPLAVAAAEAVRLEEARGKDDRLVRSIVVNPEGADGTSPLFDPVFRRWLAKVARVPVRATEGYSGAAADLLDSDAADAAGLGSLELASDMVPTLHALGFVGGSGVACEAPVTVPFVIADGDPSQPALLVRLPATAGAVKAASAEWPRFVPDQPVELGEFGGPMAIRAQTGRPVSDAELLIPANGPALAISKKPSVGVTWIAFPQEWVAEQLLESVQALAMQEGADNHCVLFVGSANEKLLLTARALFADRVDLVDHAADLCDHLKNRLIGYLGPGVVLHDRRCSAFLEQLLDDKSVASAACALVSVEPRGKGWQVSVADSGVVNGSPGTDLIRECDVAQKLWRNCFPVAQPPRDLWIARSSTVKKWVASPPPQRLLKGRHLCTTRVTASYLGARSDETAGVRAPPAAEEEAMAVRTLFG